MPFTTAAACVPSQVIARCDHVLSGSAEVPFVNRSPVVYRWPDGRLRSLLA